jgi:hypothetical protein
MEQLYKDAFFDEQKNGRLVFVMTLDDSEQLRFFVGIGQGLNDAIDVNNAIAHGMTLPAEAGIALFFGSSQ